MIFIAHRLLRRMDKWEPRKRTMARNAIIIALLWFTCMGLILTTRPDAFVMVFFGLYLPFALIYFTAAHGMFKKAAMSRRPFLAFLLQVLVYILLGLLPLSLVLFLLLNDPDMAISYAVVNTIFQLFVTTPIAWYWYKRQSRGEETITGLQKELGQSAASIDFLRSQINPHFLFNALNTIYGTALQENAVRTSEGIEKLGDMMRFMLQENMQEKIALAKELQYLDNYISLQKLRIGANPSIAIETNIQPYTGSASIAPMLLIPFVENAFKHGISFQHPSFITISLELKGPTLFFEVRNSRHQRRHRDPEKEAGGIGLENVRQRLQLLYPHRHQLVIEEKEREFNARLMLQLV